MSNWYETVYGTPVNAKYIREIEFPHQPAYLGFAAASRPSLA
jgi:hypothetical protein